MTNYNMIRYDSMYEHVSLFWLLWLQFYIVNLFILQDACVHLKLEEAASKLSESASDPSTPSTRSRRSGVAAESPRHMAVKPLHVAWHVASAQLPQLLGAQSLLNLPKELSPRMAPNGSEWLRMPQARCPSS